MSIDYFVRTWKVIYSTTVVKERQCIKIRRKPGGSENALEFEVPYSPGKKAAPPGIVEGFGDGGWDAVKSLHYVGDGYEHGAVMGTAKVGRNTHQILIRGNLHDGRKCINCEILNLGSSLSRSAARRIFADFSRYLRTAKGTEDILRIAERKGLVLEAAGEWEAEDDGG